MFATCRTSGWSTASFEASQYENEGSPKWNDTETWKEADRQPKVTSGHISAQPLFLQMMSSGAPILPGPLWLTWAPGAALTAPVPQGGVKCTPECCKEHKSKGYLVIIAGAVWPFHWFHHCAGFVPLLSSFYAPAYFWILECGPNFPGHPHGTHQPLDPDNSVEGDAQFQNPNCKSKECSSSTFHLLCVKPQKGINSA